MSDLNNVLGIGTQAQSVEIQETVIATGASGNSSVMHERHNMGSVIFDPS